MSGSLQFDLPRPLRTACDPVLGFDSQLFSPFPVGRESQPIIKGRVRQLLNNLKSPELLLTNSRPFWIFILLQYYLQRLTADQSVHLEIFSSFIAVTLLFLISLLPVPWFMHQLLFHFSLNVGMSPVSAPNFLLSSQEVTSILTIIQASPFILISNPISNTNHQTMPLRWSLTSNIEP